MFNKQVLNSSAIFVFVKYFNLFLGFVRTSIVAIILTKAQMGSLAFVYLIMEYTSYLFNLGAPNAINLQVSILRNGNKIKKNDQIINNYYTHFFIIVFINTFIAFLIINLGPKYFESFFDETVLKNRDLIFFGILIYAIRAFCNVHNRLWGNYNRFIFAELIFAIFYILGIFLFLKNDLENPVGMVLMISIISSLAHVLISRLDLSFKHFVSFSLKNSKILLPLGILLMLQNLMELYFWGIDRLFITLYLDKSSLAEFHIAHTYARGLMMFFSAFTFLIYPNLLTELSAKNNNNNNIISRISKYIVFSESILICALAIYIIAIPPLINLILENYDEMFYLFTFILMGIVIKSMTFFNASFLIARKQQKKLIFMSLIFLALTVSLYNILNFLKFDTAEDYSLIAIFVFLSFSIYLSVWTFGILRKNFKSICTLVLKIYYKFIIVYISAFTFYMINLSDTKAVILLISIIFFLYFKNVRNNLVIVVNYLHKNLLTSKK